jgi:hypothetical protein
MAKAAPRPDDRLEPIHAITDDSFRRAARGRIGRSLRPIFTKPTRFQVSQQAIEITYEILRHSEFPPHGKDHHRSRLGSEPVETVLQAFSRAIACLVDLMYFHSFVEQCLGLGIFAPGIVQMLATIHGLRRRVEQWVCWQPDCDNSSATRQCFLVIYAC